jgi:hypothetical protein
MMVALAGYPAWPQVLATENLLCGGRLTVGIGAAVGRSKTKTGNAARSANGSSRQVAEGNR